MGDLEKIDQIKTYYNQYRRIIIIFLVIFLVIFLICLYLYYNKNFRIILYMNIHLMLKKLYKWLVGEGPKINIQENEIQLFIFVDDLEKLAMQSLKLTNYVTEIVKNFINVDLSIEFITFNSLVQWYISLIFSQI